jgi:hypothetical protein
VLRKAFGEVDEAGFVGHAEESADDLLFAGRFFATHEMTPER